MIIKIIPENDIEKQNMQEEEHFGVKEFFMFGNKKVDGNLQEFHNWKSSFRYLIGSIHYFLNQIVEEQKNKTAEINGKEIDLEPKTQFIKRFPTVDQDVKIIDVNGEKENPTDINFPKQ